MRISTALSLAALIASCGGDVDDGTVPPPSGGTITVASNITADTTWTKENVYSLANHIFVESGVLTIEAGTKIVGQAGSSLVVTTGARLHAAGTRSAPIVFTSAKLEGARAPGDWGGVVLLGRSKINVAGGVEDIEGFPAGGTTTSYGGEDLAHDCGTLRYVRVEFAGFQLAMDNELNGVTLGGCGTETEVDFVQVHKGADDGVEVFGGTVNLRHVVVSQPDDDGLDWDFGWTGKAQFLLVQQNQAVGNVAIEADSNKTDNDALPRSSPEVWNATLVGSDAAPGMAGKEQFAAHFRRGTAGRIHNAVITRFADSSVDVDGDSSAARAMEGTLTIESSIFFDNGANDEWPVESGDADNDSGFDESAFFRGASLSNRFMDPMLTAMLDLDAPNMTPRPESPAMTGGATPPSDGFFEPAATFVGAFGTDDWTSGWTAYPAD